MSPVKFAPVVVVLMLLGACKSGEPPVTDPAPVEPTEAPETQPADQPPAETQPAEARPADVDAGGEDVAAPTDPVEAPEPPEEPDAPEVKAFDHAAWNTLLQDLVDGDTGYVDYAGFKKRETELDAYLDTVANAKLEDYDAQEEYPLLINAYNAYTIKLIVENYPRIKSITDLKDPWKQRRYVVAGKKMSLDQIENKRLRPVYKDPRIHFAVNCAAIGCPTLRNEAFVSSRLEEQLEDSTAKALKKTKYVKVKNGKLYLTQIFDWYGKDFVSDGWIGAKPTVASWIHPYATPEVAEFIESKSGKPHVIFMQYNWKLNKQ